jgi:hypothetical protein
MPTQLAIIVVLAVLRGVAVADGPGLDGTSARINAAIAKRLGVGESAVSISPQESRPGYLWMSVALHQMPASALRAARGEDGDPRAAARRVLEQHRDAFQIRGACAVERVQGETSVAGEQIVHLVDRIEYRRRTLQFADVHYSVTVEDGTPAYLRASVLNRDVDLDALPLAGLKSEAELRAMVRRWMERHTSLRENKLFRRFYDDPDDEAAYLEVDPVVYVAPLHEGMQDDELLQLRIQSFNGEYFVSGISGRIVAMPMGSAGGWDATPKPTTRLTH